MVAFFCVHLRQLLLLLLLLLRAHPARSTGSYTCTVPVFFFSGSFVHLPPRLPAPVNLPPPPAPGLDSTTLLLLLLPFYYRFCFYFLISFFVSFILLVPQVPHLLYLTHTFPALIRSFSVFLTPSKVRFRSGFPVHITTVPNHILYHSFHRCQVLPVLQLYRWFVLVSVLQAFLPFRHLLYATFRLPLPFALRSAACCRLRFVRRFCCGHAPLPPACVRLLRSAVYRF